VIIEYNNEPQSTLQPAAEVLTLLKASATECQLELSCHSLRCRNYLFHLVFSQRLGLDFPSSS